MQSVLILEDDLNIAKILLFNLESENLVCSWAKSIQEAKSLIEQRSFDLFIFDIWLPDGEGNEFFSDLRRQGNKTPTLFLTAHPEEKIAVFAFEDGAIDFVRKPFRNRELIARLHAILNRSVAKTDTGRSSC